MITPTVEQHAWWLASRASGLVALALVTVSVALGLVMAGRIMRKPGRARVLMAIHEQTAVIGLVAIGVHGVTLLGDPWLHPGVAGISLPGAIGYQPVWTGIGIAAGYLAAILGLSFYFRSRIGPRLWRRAHRLTALVYLMAVVHTLGAGTDASTPWLRGWLLLTAPAITALFVIRVASAKRGAPRRAASPPARAPQPLLGPAPRGG